MKSISATRENDGPASARTPGKPKQAYTNMTDFIVVMTLILGCLAGAVVAFGAYNSGTGTQMYIGFATAAGVFISTFVSAALLGTLYEISHNISLLVKKT